MWLGVTVGIPEPYKTVLSQARAQAGDPLAGEIPPHVTLLPPTEVSEDDLGKVYQQLERVARRHHCFTMGLEGTDTFRPISPVVFVALSSGWDECSDLQADLNTGVLAQEREFPYHPHVTIAHNLTANQLDHAQQMMRNFQGEFRVSTIELFEHVGQEWRELRSFALSAHPNFSI